jgi:putative ABC transport system ATP-binding protein
MSTVTHRRPQVATAPLETTSDPNAVAVRCRGLTKEFTSGETKTLALRGIDLDVQDGNMTLLVGPSGCGKTTLISIIAGLLNPTHGEVEVFGHHLQRLRNGQLVAFRRDHIGFVFQQYNLLPSLTAVENAAVPLIVQGRPRPAALKTATSILDAVGLGNKLNSLPSQLSGGQQQRVAIARALSTQPKLLVCDEPTAALDAQSGRRVMELLRRVAIEPGRAVIVVTHDSRVFEFGDQIVHMSDGAVELIESKPDLAFSHH